MNSSSWEKVEFEAVLNENELTYREFLDAAILTGTDEVQGPYKGHIEEAIAKVRQADDLDELEAEQNEYLRGQSLRVDDPAPSFEELHSLYSDPPVISRHNRPDPTSPNPDLSAVGDFLFQNLDQKPEMLETLLDPIRDEM
jgi:5'-3' exonuclease